MPGVKPGNGFKLRMLFFHRAKHRSLAAGVQIGVAKVGVIAQNLEQIVGEHPPLDFKFKSFFLAVTSRHQNVAGQRQLVAARSLGKFFDKISIEVRLIRPCRSSFRKIKLANFPLIGIVKTAGNRPGMTTIKDEGQVSALLLNDAQQNPQFFIGEAILTRQATIVTNHGFLQARGVK